MKDTVDFKLLEFATKGKHFIGEIVNQTREDFYSMDIRIPMKVLRDYYVENKDLPSYDMACEYAETYPNIIQTKEVLYEAYKLNKELLTDGDFPELIKQVKRQYNDAYVKEKLKHITNGFNTKYDIEDVNEKLKKIALEVSTINNAGDIYSQGTLQESAKQRYLDYKRIKENPELARGVMSGFKQLDALTNGFRGCELIMVSGPSGSGKSITLMNMALNAWLGTNKPTMLESEWNDDGNDVWFVTIENSKELQERRIGSCLAGVSCNGIRDGKLDEASEKKYFEALKFQSKYGKRFHTSDLGKNITMAVIEAEYEKILRIFKPNLIVIDYLGKMKATNPTGQDWMDMGSVALDMYEFTKSLKDTPVLTASQMKAAVRTQSGLKRFEGDVENISRSKLIGDNITMNLQIVKDENYNNSSFLEMIVSKSRDGETGGSIMLSKEFWRQTVCDPINDFKVAKNFGEINNG